MLQKENIINEDEYRRRITDRILFTSRDLLKFNEETNQYEMVAMPSTEMVESMKEALTREEEADMIKDLAYLQEQIKSSVMPELVDIA